jgi:hypothetical protein
VARPAQALPKYKSDCSSCHSVAPVGTVAATPSKTSLTPGETYTVGVGVDLGASGKAGYWLANNDALTPAVDLTGGPATSPFTANLTAPATAGTYAYLVWGAKGGPSSGQALMTTFQITVADNTGGGTGGGDTGGGGDPGGGTGGGETGGGGGTIIDPSAPTVVTPSAAKVFRGKKATLKYRVNDADPNLGSATAVIKIKNRAGKVVKTIRPGVKAVNVLQKASFTCKLAKGKYKFFVTATDASGNVTVKAAVNKLTVR